MNISYILISIINIAFQAYTWLIVARALLSFMNFRTYHPLLQFVYEITEPVLSLFRRLLPRTGPLDFSPILAILSLQIANQLVIQLLYFLLLGRY